MKKQLWIISALILFVFSCDDNVVSFDEQLFVGNWQGKEWSFRFENEEQVNEASVSIDVNMNDNGRGTCVYHLADTFNFDLEWLYIPSENKFFVFIERFEDSIPQRYVMDFEIVSATNDELLFRKETSDNGFYDPNVVREEIREWRLNK